MSAQHNKRVELSAEFLECYTRLRNNMVANTEERRQCDARIKGQMDQLNQDAEATVVALASNKTASEQRQASVEQEASAAQVTMADEMKAMEQQRTDIDSEVAVFEDEKR